MVFKHLGVESFDKQVLSFVELDPANMVKLVFSADDEAEEKDDFQTTYGVDLFGNSNLHHKNINILHLACQENLL